MQYLAYLSDMAHFTSCGWETVSFVPRPPLFFVNSLHVTGTFMCPRNKSVLHDGHGFVPADVIQSNGTNSEAKRAFGINPYLLSSNKCRPHLSIYITRRQSHREGRKGQCLFMIVRGRGQTLSNAKLFLEHREQVASRFHVR